MIKAYVIGFILVGIFFGGAYTVQVFFVSLLVALIPLATSKFWFAFPIGILLYSFIFGDSTFAWLCLAFAPFHWISFMHLVIAGIQKMFGIDD